MAPFSEERQWHHLRGRFRSFFLTTLQRFLTSDWQHRQTEKRGGGKTHLPIVQATETRCQKNLADQRPPEASFDREWAAAVWGRALGPAAGGIHARRQAEAI